MPNFETQLSVEVKRHLADISSKENEEPVFAAVKRHLPRRVPIMVGISPGNPYYYKDENLTNLFDFANQHSDQVKLFITDVIGEHNYRAVGSTNPERASRVKGNRLRNKCKTVMTKNIHIRPEVFTHVDWKKEVESCDEYHQHLALIVDLFENNEEFRGEVLDVTEVALKCLCNGRKKGGKENTDKQTIISETAPNPASPKQCEGTVAMDNKESEEEGEAFDVIEGAQYLLKELAFFLAMSSVYKDFQEFIFIYHRPWPVLEKLFNGHYDGVCRDFMGFIIFG